MVNPRLSLAAESAGAFRRRRGARRPPLEPEDVPPRRPASQAPAALASAEATAAGRAAPAARDPFEPRAILRLI